MRWLRKPPPVSVAPPQDPTRSPSIRSTLVTTARRLTSGFQLAAVVVAWGGASPSSTTTLPELERARTAAPTHIASSSSSTNAGRRNRFFFCTALYPLAPRTCRCLCPTPGSKQRNQAEQTTLAACVRRGGCFGPVPLARVPLPANLQRPARAACSDPRVADVAATRRVSRESGVVGPGCQRSSSAARPVQTPAQLPPPACHRSSGARAEPPGRSSPAGGAR